MISIARDGEEVDAIDPSRPGTYVVTATYIDDDGNVSIVRRTYIVGADEVLRDPSAPQEPKGEQTGGSDGTTRLRLLAATGDDGAWPVAAGAMALLGVGAALGARLRLRRS